MNRKFSFILALSVVALASCDYQKNNTINQDDLRAKDLYVYGAHPDSMARQMKNKYTATPENEARAAKIKEKLYGATPVAAVAPVATDSAATK
jgi:uncharacterized lipoprotein